MMMMLIVTVNVCVLSATAAIVIDGGYATSIRSWCMHMYVYTCVRAILYSKRVTHSRDFFSFSTCYSYTTMLARIYTHTHTQ